MNTTEERFLLGEWLKIYTDGSEDEKSNTVAGIHWHYLPVGQIRINFNSEFKAIFNSLQIVSNKPNLQSLNILTESKSIIEAITPYSANKVLKDIKWSIKIL